MLPLVALVGRPNVGKSSLFNWLAGRRISIVDPTAGVTRDRVSTVIEVGDRFCELMDTGGMGIGIYPHAGFIHVDIRPEPSYRWVDYSPPGSSDMGQPKSERKRAPNT